MRLIALLLLGLVPAVVLAQKEALAESVRKREAESWDMALKIWNWAEVGYKETRSSALLADRLDKAGFTVQRGVAKIPTAFTATIGEGKPVLGILGEFDALPGLSQQAVPFKQTAKDVSAGHGCGHHLFGVASVSASIALAEQIM